MFPWTILEHSGPGGTSVCWQTTWAIGPRFGDQSTNGKLWRADYFYIHSTNSVDHNGLQLGWQLSSIAAELTTKLQCYFSFLDTKYETVLWHDFVGAFSDFSDKNMGPHNTNQYWWSWHHWLATKIHHLWKDFFHVIFMIITIVTTNDLETVDPRSSAPSIWT